MHPALQEIAAATRGTPFEGDLWQVGGAVRDELLGAGAQDDFDLVTTGDAAALARLLFERGVSTIPPVTYERFGTAMVRVREAQIELVAARRESYDDDSRKPHVEPATLEEDARRRDFTVNTLMRNLHTDELWDPLGQGLSDLRARTLRTPLGPAETFRDDPLRMLRAVRFRWKLGFDPAPGLYEAVRDERERLRIVSMERIRDEVLKMLRHPSAPDALKDLMDLGLIEIFASELLPMVGCEQGSYHHLDVWDHSRLVVRNAGHEDLILTLAALLHDVGKPSTRFIDENGNTRFFGHEGVGAEMTQTLLRRLKLPQRDVDAVARLVKAHMRLGSTTYFTKAAARRLLRDLDEDVDRLLALVEADASALRPGVRALDLAPIRARIAEVRRETPPETLHSPLSGSEIIEILGLEPGPAVGRVKSLLTERVLEGQLPPGDKEAAKAWLEAEGTKAAEPSRPNEP
jgi:poly(A) polymerase